MGWYYQTIRGRSTADKDAFLRSEVEQIADKPGKASITVLKSAFVGSTWYAAVRFSVPEHAPYIIAYVYLTRMTSDGEYGYKPMDESVGPCETSCPVGIMALLTPIEKIPGNTGYAADWRARVAAAHAAKAELQRHRGQITNGTRIRFEHSIRFTDGQHFDRFVANWMERRGRNILTFIPIDPNGRWLGGRYSINRRTLANAIIEPIEPVTPFADTRKNAA